MSEEYECTIGMKREYAHDFILEMAARHPDGISVTKEETAFNVFYLAGDYVIVVLAGNHINNSPLWHDMTWWCSDHLDEDEWYATEVCLEYIPVGGTNNDIFYVGTHPMDDQYRMFRTADKLFEAIRQEKEVIQ